MDRMLYIAMTGAQHTLYAQQVNSNNLANVDTSGFKADIARFKPVPVTGDTFDSRVYVLSETSGTDFTPGALIPTGRDLDVAIKGKGWLAVQNEDGTESYTRNGSLNVTAEGLLVNSDNRVILGEGGPITVPPYQSMEIGDDGSLSVIPKDSNTVTPVFIDRIKLVDSPQRLIKALDGVFNSTTGEPLSSSPEVKLASGYEEASNVNAVQAVTEMISLARQFEIQLKLMRTAQENDETAASLLNLNS